MEKPDLSHFPPALHRLDALNALRKEESPHSERALDHTVWRKLDMLVLPLFAGFFLCVVMAKINIWNARVAGLQQSLAMSNYQFAMALIVTYVLSMVAQFPCNMLVRHIGPNLMLPSMITAGGIVAASQGLARNYSEFLICRFLLGLCQGGIFPMVFLCLSCFYPPKLLQRRLAVLAFMMLLTAVLSSLLAAAIVHIDGVGGKPAWAWIFIVEGLIAIAFGAMAFFFLSPSPEKVHFLTEAERAYVVSILEDTGSVSENDEQDKFSWVEVIKAAKSPHVWFLAIIFLFLGTIQSGFAFFLPAIVAGFGHTGSRAQLMSAAPFAVAFVLVVVSDYFQRRARMVMCFALFSMTGYAMYLGSPSSLVGYASLFFSVPGAFSGLPASIAWVVNNNAPHTRRATALVITFVLFELGSLFSLFLLGYLSTDTKHTTAMVTFIAMSIGIFILSTANWIYLQRENRLKAERRQNMGKGDERDDAGDRSAWFIYDL